MADTGPHTAEHDTGPGPGPAPGATAGAGSPTGQRGVQFRYHRELFPALHDWERTERSIVEFSGEEGPAGLLGLDQMGHFGPQGCDLVADAVLAHGEGPLDVCELGSGFGGALRYTVDKISAGGLSVRRAHGVDLVPEHCAVSRNINRAQGRTGMTDICASATAVPLPGASLDVVWVTGSMPHFPAPGEVLREAGRLLRPGGLLVLTEEVSLTPGDEEPSDAFRVTHPRGVFFTTPLADRLRDLERAGFADVVREDLTPWAVALLTDRLKVVRIFRGSVAGIYGTASADLIRDTLDAARTEFLAARLSPALITARRA
ncbi:MULTISPECIES: class I SAM-dependent methyltransferase [unclassified Streptomyces]|uniref:class I SAM-dependent methyltransferase n=1 Tax=unclassified Streptomyces TaxID=2593676 RepID=UPI0022714F5F|nr:MULTISPECIES: class I SAM-dependent methyltransferase [unclassified Streptomyces]MCY0919413.1 class I SAM-dependent methyltransferase [Streptomyces sp. H27-G5]MCY0961984.1 class I SAM-dependent methyltransferase [Streptomyces sp. H27-H5]